MRILSWEVYLPSNERGGRVLSDEWIEFQALVDGTLAKCREILVERGRSYASDTDPIENFKHTSKIMTELGFEFHGKPVTPEAVALFFTSVKVQRWANRIREGQDRDDDTVDGVNYFLLGKACRKEGEE